MSETSKYQNTFHFNHAPGNVNTGDVTIQRDQVGIQHNYAPEHKQNLAEAAKEIQQLLDQLSQTYPTTTEREKQAVVNQAIEQAIKRNPTFKARLRNALKEGGIEALKVLFAPIGIPIEMARGWIEAE